MALQNECFRSYTGIGLSVCPPARPSVCQCVRVPVCIQNTNFCKSAGKGIKSHLVTALVSTCLQFKSKEKTVGKREIALNSVLNPI